MPFGWKTCGGRGDFLEMFNQLLHFGDISYYQLKTGREIDFIVD